MNTFGGWVTAGLIPLAVCALAAAAADSRVLMEEMTTTEVRDAIQAGKTTVLIFNASTEASGPHLAMGKHIFRARYLGERIARELGNALVAPIMPFAPTADERRFPGTIHVSPEAFSRVNEEVADSMVKAGFKYIVLMGDHDGNQEPLKTLAPKLDQKYRSQGVRVFYSSDAYTKSNGEIEGYLREHGFPPCRRRRYLPIVGRGRQIRPPRQNCRGWPGAACGQSLGAGHRGSRGRPAQVFSGIGQNVSGLEGQERGSRDSQADPGLSGEIGLRVCCLEAALYCHLRCSDQPNQRASN